MANDSGIIKPSSETLKKFQDALGYHFANPKHLTDALDISEVQANANAAKTTLRNKKIVVAADFLQMAMAHNAYRDSEKKDWDEGDLTNARQLWIRRQGALSHVAQELGLDEVIIHRRDQPVNLTALHDTFLLVLQAMREDAAEQHMPAQDIHGYISELLKKHMPTLIEIPQKNTVSGSMLGQAPSPDNVIDMLQQSKEFQQRGFYFQWSEERPPELRTIPDGSELSTTSRSLRLMQRLPHPQTGQMQEKEIIAIDARGRNVNDALISASRNMINEMMSRHYFIEILRNIGTGKDGYAGEIPTR